MISFYKNFVTRKGTVMTSSTLVDIEPDFSEELPKGTQLLSGQYTIESYLNHGGFGITYLAADSLSRQVVIKECFPGSLCRRSRLAVQARSRAHVNDLQGVVRLFVQEAQSLSKLEHPNIVGVHQVFEDHGTAYMALDYVKGSDLLSYIEGKQKRLSPAQIKTVLEKVLDAVRFVHDAGVLHRDISPDNIILTEALEPILIDFGAAREQATKATQALSALRVVKDGYSPQEFYLAGSTQAPSSDLYSLAATFYHLITGETPPDSQIRITAHVAQQADPYVPLGQRTKDFDEGFCSAIDRALAILPQDRVQTASDWKQLLVVEPTEVTPPVEKPMQAEKPEPAAVDTKVKSRPVKAKIKPKHETAAISRPRKIKPVKKGFRKNIPALLMGSAAVLVLVGGTYMAPHDQVSTAATAPIEPPIEVEPQVMLAKVDVPTSETPAPVIESGAAAEMRIDTAALATTWADGLIALDWRADLPFELGRDATVITSVASVPSGARITAINGQPVADLAAVQASIKQAADASDGTTAPLSLSWIGPDTDAEVITELSAKIVYHTSFENGLAFETLYSGQSWVTKVVDAPENLNAELQVGDEIVALIPDNERITGGASLAEITSKALLEDRPNLQFAVRRDDALWIADLHVTRDQS